MINDFKKRIYGFECDIYGHLNNSNYLQVLEAARSEALQDIEMPVDKLKSLGWHVYIYRFELDYIKPILLEDIATVKSRIIEMNRARSKWCQEIYNSAGDLCFRAYVYVVHARDGKPGRVPDEIWTYFERLA